MRAGAACAVVGGLAHGVRDFGRERPLKDSTIRINETLAFIQNCNLLSAHERQSALALATNFINVRHPPAHAGQPGYEAFSTGMSLGFHLASDPNNYRRMKRGVYLLIQAINDIHNLTLAAVNPAQLSDTAAQILFQDLLRKAACVYDAAHGSTQAAQLALLALQNHPLDFLRTNKLFIGGSAVRDATQGDQNVLAFYFGYDATDRYKIGLQANPGYTAFYADSVVAQHWTLAGDWQNHQATGGDFTLIRAIELTSPLMVTTQFTGCSFCMKRHNGHVYCAHVVPTRDPAANAAPILTGLQLAQRISNNNGVQGDFHNPAAGGGALSIYAPGFHQNLVHNSGYPNNVNAAPNGWMTIVGVQRGHDYQIYSQVILHNAISAAQRIF